MRIFRFMVVFGLLTFSGSSFAILDSNSFSTTSFNPNSFAFDDAGPGPEPGDGRRRARYGFKMELEQ